MAIDALLEPHLREEILEADGEGLLDLAVDGDVPGPELQLLGQLEDPLVGRELVEIVVGGVELFRRHRPSGIGKGGIAPGGVGRWLLGAGRTGRKWRHGKPGRCGKTEEAGAGDELAAAEKHRLGRDQTLRQLPALFADDLHGCSMAVRPKEGHTRHRTNGSKLCEPHRVREYDKSATIFQ